MKLAFLFPGQGMQEPMMTAPLDRASAEWDVVKRALGSHLYPVLEQGGPQLERTDVLQPLLVATCLAVTARLLEAGVCPTVVAGHSVGEIAALAAAGALSAEDAIHLAAVRGRLMAREAARRPGGMLALLEASAEKAEAAINVGARHGVIGLAAVNAPEQWVLSGELASLEAVGAQFASRRLPVAGAWHSELMADALPELLHAFRALPLRPVGATFVVNGTGRPLGESEDLAQTLAGQLVRPVQWAASLATLERLEVTDVVTVGPGRILRGLVRKNLGSRVNVHTTEDSDLGRTIERLKGHSRG